MFTPIVARPEFDKSRKTTGSTEDTKVNIEAEDEVPLSKRKKTCGCPQMRRKTEKETLKGFQKKEDMWIYSTKRKKRSSLYLRNIFNE